jgi:hypothetical protein
MITRRSKSVEKQDDSFSIKVSINVGGRLIEQDLEESLSIPTSDKLTLPMILKMLAENPVLHARWNVLYNEAVYEYDMQKTKFEVWLSKKSAEYRKELEKVAKGRVTDRMVEDMIKADPDYEKMSDDLATSKKNMKHIFVLANGFGEKGDKIVTIASMLKWEAEKLGNKFLSDRKQYHHIKREFEEENPTSNIDLNVNDGWPT